jgi:protein FRA10AC1
MDLTKLRESYRFIEDADDATAGGSGDGWGAGLAAAYDRFLTKDFGLSAVAPDGRLGIRWRTRREVINGKGQYTCGMLDCDAVVSLSTYEVPFAYSDAGRPSVQAAALVRLRLCGLCALRAFKDKASRGTDEEPEAAASAAPAAKSRREEDDEAAHGEARGGKRRRRRRRHHQEARSEEDRGAATEAARDR